MEKLYWITIKITEAKRVEIKTRKWKQTENKDRNFKKKIW